MTRITVNLSEEQANMVRSIRNRVEARTGKRMNLDSIMTYVLHYARATEAGYSPKVAQNDAMVLAGYDSAELDRIANYIKNEVTHAD